MPNTTVTRVARFYAWTAADEDGTVKFLPDNAEHPPGTLAEVTRGPYYCATSRSVNGIGRVLYSPYRPTMGTDDYVREEKPWHLFIRGEAVNQYATQAEAIAHARKAYRVDIPVMEDEDGIAW